MSWMDPLDAARALVAEQFPDALAAFLSRSVLTAHRTATSDLDIVVVLSGPPAPYRHTTRYGDWLVELFVHSRPSVQYYWDIDAATGKASLLRMCAEGRILAGADDLADTIQAAARARLTAGPPPLTPAARDRLRYALTDLADDFTGCENETELVYIAAAMLRQAGELALLIAGRWLGTGKWLPRELDAFDKDLADLLLRGHREAVTSGARTAFLQGIGEVLDRAGGPLREGYRVAGAEPPPRPS